MTMTMQKKKSLATQERVTTQSLGNNEINLRSTLTLNNFNNFKSKLFLFSL